MWANLSSHISRVSAGAAPPFSNGAVITPLHNLTHRLSQPQNRGYRLDGGSRGKSGTESLFLKAGAELSGPLFVYGHFCTPHNVCSCYMLRGIQLEEMGNSIFSTKNFKSLKKSTFWKKIANNWVLYSNKAGKNGQEWKWNDADYRKSNCKIWIWGKSLGILSQWVSFSAIFLFDQCK